MIFLQIMLEKFLNSKVQYISKSLLSSLTYLFKIKEVIAKPMKKQAQHPQFNDINH